MCQTSKEIFDAKMTNLADKINAKAGTNVAMDIDDMADAVEGITRPTLYAPVVTGGVLLSIHVPQL